MSGCKFINYGQLISLAALIAWGNQIKSNYIKSCFKTVFSESKLYPFYLRFDRAIKVSQATFCSSMSILFVFINTIVYDKKHSAVLYVASTVN
jgi:hypothetical protein